MAVSVVPFSFCRIAQPEAQRSSSQLDDGFLYCVSNFSGPQLNQGAPRAPSAWCGFPYHVSSLTSTVWILVLTELYNSSVPTQSSTQSWCLIVIKRNNCHAVHRSFSSGVSVYEYIMGFFTLFHFVSQFPPTRFLSITGHWDVSLPSGASLWNGIFAQVEGQNTTCIKDQMEQSGERSSALL